MPERRVRVASSIGLHARPAMMFAQAAAAQRISVTVARPGGAPVDATSVLLVLALDVRPGEEVVLAAEGAAAEQAMDALAALLESDLDRRG